jgi:methyl-accepting chemotaxis protein
VITVFLAAGSATTSATTSGPSFQVSGWLAVLGIVAFIASSFVAIAAVAKKVVQPMLRVGVVVERAVPVLLSIAQKFTDDDGGERLSAELAGLVESQERAAENQVAIVNRIDEQAGRMDTFDERLAEIDRLLREVSVAVTRVPKDTGDPVSH